MKKSTGLNIDNITLQSGNHRSKKDGHCLMEAVSIFSGEKFGDSPNCVDPVLADFGREWNDSMRSDEERNQLKQYIVRLPGTAGSEELSSRRLWLVLDWLVRTSLPEFLSILPSLKCNSETIRNLSEIRSQEDVEVAYIHIKTALSAVDAAWDAAKNAAWDSAWDSALTAAKDAALTAAKDSVRNAVVNVAANVARDAALNVVVDAALTAAMNAALTAAMNAALTAALTAAKDAAWGAVRDSARNALDPTVKKLQISAHDLFSRIIDLR